MGATISTVDEAKMGTLSFLFNYFTSSPCFFIKKEKIEKAVSKLSRLYSKLFKLKKINEEECIFEIQYHYDEPGIILLKKLGYNIDKPQKIIFIDIDGTDYYAIISNEYETVIPYYVMGIIRDQVENFILTRDGKYDENDRIETFDFNILYEIVEDYKKDKSISYIGYCIEFLIEKWYSIIVFKNMNMDIEYEDCLLYGYLRNPNFKNKIGIGKKISPHDYIPIAQKCISKQITNHIDLKALLPDHLYIKFNDIINQFGKDINLEDFQSYAYLFYENWRKEWILEMKDLEWFSYDRWSIEPNVYKTKKENTVLRFHDISKRCYSLCGGIMDAFATEGGIDVSNMCKGPEIEYLQKFGLGDEQRLDLRGVKRYYLGTRGLISCQNFICLEYILKIYGYDCQLNKNGFE